MAFQNEIILIASIFVFFGGLVAMLKFFGKTGIYAWTVICTIAANIEVLILVHAFGLEIMTRGVFAKTVLIGVAIVSASAGTYKNQL